MKDSRVIVGVDEAGRGPILGPMVMVALAFAEEDIKKLEWLGVKDSKLLSSFAREELFERIREVVKDFRVEVIEPDAIDLSLKESESNLNWLEADTSARMVSDVDNLKSKIGIDFGSGYLSDPKTQDFLLKHYDKYPELFRRMWQPYKELMEQKKQKRLGEF
ncbi:hypothetical protein HZC32_01560 [Candidatus Woesearchaeota archaeon]|nr:hypothetical protein [Candidatus Woesearchaeota archaeon]